MINHPNDAVEEDRDWTWAASIILGVFTLGLVHGACALAEWCFSPQNKSENETLQRTDEVRESHLGKGIKEESKVGAFASFFNKVKRAVAGKVALKDCPLASSIVFGKADWEKIFGDVGEEPLLPANIEEVLSKDCEVIPGKKVHETHVLVLVPETIDGKPLELTEESLGSLLKKQKSRHAETILNGNLIKSSSTSHWVLMPKDIIGGKDQGPHSSRNKPYSRQKEIVKELAKETNIPYEVPSIRDAMVCMLMHYIKTGERICSYCMDFVGQEQSDLTYAVCCDEYKILTSMDGKSFRVENIAIGAFGPKGGLITRGSDNRSQTSAGAPSFGMIPVWKF